MSDVLIQRRRDVTVGQQRPQSRPLPIGIGLGIGAAVSLALWAGLAWAVVQFI